MRLHLGSIPDSIDFAFDKPWRPLREPTPWVMQLLALPIGVTSAAAVVFLWRVMTPLGAGALSVTPTAFLLLFVGVALVHELIHACVHPMAGCSRRSILGFWPSRVLLYAHYDGELPRDRFVCILLMPLFIISIAPLLVAAATQVTSGWLAVVSAFNVLLASGDIIGASLVLSQIPSSATVRNQGWRTRWRVGETTS